MNAHDHEPAKPRRYVGALVAAALAAAHAAPTSVWLLRRASRAALSRRSAAVPQPLRVTTAFG